MFIAQSILEITDTIMNKIVSFVNISVIKTFLLPNPKNLPTVLLSCMSVWHHSPLITPYSVSRILMENLIVYR